MRNKMLILCFLVVLIAAFIPRFLNLFSINVYFATEQGTGYLVLKRLVYDHQFFLVSPAAGGLKGIPIIPKDPGWAYLTSIPFMMSNGNPFAEKTLMFLLSVLTPILGFIFIKKQFNLLTATFVGLSLAISPYLISQSGMLGTPFSIAVLVVAFLYFLFRAFKKDKKSIFIIALIVGLMDNLEPAISGILFIELLFIAVILLVRKQIFFRTVLISIGIFFLTLLPIFINEIVKNFETGRSIFKILEFSKHNAVNLNSLWQSKFIYNFDIFSWNFRSSFSPNWIVSLLLFLVIYALSFIYIKNKKNEKPKRLYVAFLALSPVFICTLLMFYPSHIMAWWLIELTVFYCYLLGILFGYFWKNKIFLPMIIIISIYLFAAFSYNTYHFYKNEFVFPPTLNMIRQVEAIDYVYKDAKNRPFNFLIPPTIATDDYDYLFWWRGKTMFGFQPQTNLKKGLLYLIIEADSSKTPEYKSWLRNYKIGSIVQTKELGNRYIVQKRLVN